MSMSNHGFACNYCNIQRIRRDAKELDQKIIIRGNAVWGMNGVNVYAIPEGVKTPGHIDEGDEFHKEYWVCWFAELTDHCAC